MSFNYPAGTILNIQGLCAWPETPTQLPYWGLPTNISTSLSLEEAFKWRWRTGSIDFDYKREDISGATPFLIESRTATLTPYNPDATSMERWVLGPDLIYEGISSTGQSETFFMLIAAHAQGTAPFESYSPEQLSYVIAPDLWASDFLYSNGFSLTMSDTTLSYNYLSANGIDRFTYTYSRVDWL